MLSYRPVKTNQQTSTPADRALVLKQIYQQILERQPYVSERRQLADLEQNFINGKIGIRHFLKTLAISPLYLEQFYEHSSNVKFIENAFKHFLGRQPQNEEEIRYCDNLLLREGVGAMISSLVDSEEYRKAFGCSTVPYWRKDAYDSPSAYLENHLLQTEHAGQRGWAVPTLYWHELHLDCYAGHCRPAFGYSTRIRS